MRVVGEVNKYLTVTEPYKMKDEAQRERLATVLHVAAQCVGRLQHAALAVPPALRQQGAPGLRRRGRRWCRCRASSSVEDLDPDHGAGLGSYPVITGDYSGTPAWASRPIEPGTTVGKPTPVFTKLDPRSSTRSSPGWALTGRSR